MVRLGTQLLIVSGEKWPGGNICINVALSVITSPNFCLASSGWQRKIGSRMGYTGLREVSWFLPLQPPG